MPELQQLTKIPTRYVLKTTGSIGSEVFMFDSNLAISGGLCVMVPSNFSPSTANFVLDTDTDNFKGAGVCRHDSVGRYAFTVDSVIYYFDSEGKPISVNASAYRLYSCISTSNAVSASSSNSVGTVISRSGSIISTRASGGSEDTTQVTDVDSKIIIDDLNARDQFASQALRGLLSHINDPSSLSPTEISYYCEVAYKWAANMMAAAANVRASWAASSEPATTRATNVGSLDNNVEKLLNNIVYAIEQNGGGSSDISAVVDALEEIYGGSSIGDLSNNLNAIKQALKGSSDPTVAAAVAGLGTTDNPFVISGGGGGGSTDVSGIVAALKASTDKTVSNAITDAKTVISGAIEDLSTINIGNSGLGRNTSNPVYTHDDSVANAITNKNLIGIGNNGLGRDENNKIHVQVYGAGGGSSIRKSDLAEIGASSVDSFGVFNGTGVFGWLDADSAASAVFPEGVSRNDLDSSLQTSLKEGLLNKQSIRNYVNAIYNASDVKLCFAGYAQGLSTVYNFYPELRRNLKVGDYFILLGWTTTNHYGLCFKVINGSSTNPYAVEYIYNDAENHLPLQFSENSGFSTSSSSIGPRFQTVNDYAASILNTYYTAYKDGGVMGAASDGEYLADWRNTDFIVIVDKNTYDPDV